MKPEGREELVGVAPVIPIERCGAVCSMAGADGNVRSPGAAIGAPQCEQAALPAALDVEHTGQTSMSQSLAETPAERPAPEASR